MKSLKKIVVLMTLAAMVQSSGNNVEALDYCSTVAGCGYQECCEAPCLTPSIAFATVALAGIILLALQHSHGNLHTHGHD